MNKRWLGIVITTVSIWVVPISPAFSQAEEASLVEEVAATSATSAPEDGLYFADILVRGQSVFQVGSLNNLLASERAAIVSRRIASLLERTDGYMALTTWPVPNQRLINNQANNRVLMTVTEQDAQDFGLSLKALA